MEMVYNVMYNCIVCVVLLHDHREFERVCGSSLKAGATYSDNFLIVPFLVFGQLYFITPSFRTASKAEPYEYSNTSSVPNLDANSCPTLD